MERVARVLRAAAIDARLEELPTRTPTAEAAAQAVGCDQSQIVKSLVFVCDERPVLALVPGDRRADAARIAESSGAERARIASAEEVVAATGFEAGGVAPFPVDGVTRVLLDRGLLVHDFVWIGAGSSRHMAALAPLDLVRLAQAEAADISS